MKARVQPTRRQKQAARRAANEELELITQRFLKIAVTTLHTKFGFGHDRAIRFIEAFGEIASEATDDDIYYTHLDRVVIDELNLPFDRDDNERK